MEQFGFGRRAFLRAGAAVAGASLLSGPGLRAAAAAVTEISPLPLPPPIGRTERLARLVKARVLMKRNSIGSILIESGPSLDYFTGVQWSRSERLTAAVIPAEGEPIIVTPFFERPSVAESLGVPAEILRKPAHKRTAAFLHKLLHRS